MAAIAVIYLDRFKRDLVRRTAKLVDLPSLLYVDATGVLSGRRFRVMGRLRYQYTSGMWDEWFVAFDDGGVGWLVEDEGEYKLYAKETLTSAVPPFESLEVGNVVSIAGRQVFVTEKGQANIAGGEGQWAFSIIPGESVAYLDGSSGDDLISVEYTQDEIELSVGRPVAHGDLIVDEEAF